MTTTSLLKISIISLSLFTSLVFADEKVLNNESSPQFVVHLLDYLASDYAGAVDHGKIVSPSEFSEQREFVQKVVDLSETFPSIKNNSALMSKVVTLKTIINAKAEASEVNKLARDIQKEFIVAANIKSFPTNWPNIANGKILFQQNCAACHGETGLGDGASGESLTPRPANFHRIPRMNEISAFHSYNAIRLGVPGTGMQAWSQFSDSEVWDLSFYVMSIRHQELAKSLGADNKFIEQLNSLTLEEIATLSDNQLKEKIQGKDDQEKSLALAFLRNKNDTPSNKQYIGKAKSLLNDSLAAFSKKSPNSRDSAKSLALRSYLEGIEPIEPLIKANNPQLVAKIETVMSKVRKTIADPNGSVDVLTSEINQAQLIFNEVEESIQSKELSFSVAFSGAFAIILREGFEAVLIILTLLSVIKAFGNKRAALWVHAGWSSALFLGFVTWFLSGFLMRLSGASREMLEATTSTVAVLILLYFGFWLHRQTEISRWKKFIQDKVQGAMDNKNLMGLASIAFISVFREAFETVLFVRALWFQTNSGGKNAIGLGLIAALGLIFVFSYFTLRYSKKMPIRELFKVSSFLTSALSFILAGKAVHSMQEAGLVNATMVPWNFRVDTLGFFPTWQTMTAQIVTLAIAVLLLNLNATKKSTSLINKTA